MSLPAPIKCVWCCLFSSAVSTSPSPHMNPAGIDLGQFPRASWVNTIMHFPPLLNSNKYWLFSICACVCPSVCLSLGVSADKQGNGAGPRKGSTFWKSKFDIKSNQLLQPIPSLTAGVSYSTTKNTKLSLGPFIQMRKKCFLSWNPFSDLQDLVDPPRNITASQHIWSP